MGSYGFDDYKKDHVDGKIKDNNGDPRHGGGNNRPDATLTELDTNGATVAPAAVGLENFDSMDYETIYNRMANVSENISPGYQDTLRGVAEQVAQGMSDMKDRLQSLEGEGGWKGKTHDAAMANLLKSADVPTEFGKAALSLGVLSEYFSQTMSTNKHNIRDQWGTYQDCLSWYSSETDTVKRYFNTFAQDVMKNYYSPEISDIAKHQPVVDATAVPDVGGAQDGDGNDSGGNDNGGNSGGNDNGGNDSGGNDNGSNDGGGGNDNGSNDDGGGGNNASPPPFSPPNLTADNPGGGSQGDGSPGGGSPGGGSPSGGGFAGADSTPKQSFNPPNLADLKSPAIPSDSADRSGSGSPSGSGSGSGGGSPSDTDTPSGTPPTLPSLGANSPQLPDLGASTHPSNTDPSGTGAKFDPSTVLTDPKSIKAADKLFNDPKTADAAKKLFGDPKFADAAKTLFGDGAKGLLSDPKALDAAKTLFGDPDAADAAKTLFGDPDTAKAAQKLLNDPHLDDLGQALQDSGALRANGLPGVGSVNAAGTGVGAGDVSRSVLGQSALGNGAAIPGVAAGTVSGPSDGASSLIGGIMDGVNQIVQTAQQGAAPQPPGFGGGPGFDGAPGGPGDHPGGGAGHGGGAGGGAAGPGKMHLPTAGAPVAAANFNPVAHANALHPGIDAAQVGSGGGGAPSGGGHGGGGKGGEGKDHKGSKALRGSHNGQDLIGQPDAVVSVIGEDGADGGSGWSMDT